MSYPDLEDEGLLPFRVCRNSSLGTGRKAGQLMAIYELRTLNAKSNRIYNLVIPCFGIFVSHSLKICTSVINYFMVLTSTHFNDVCEISNPHQACAQPFDI